MSKLTSIPKSGWLVLVVVAIGVLMILPAGSVLSGRAGSGALTVPASSLSPSAVNAAGARPVTASNSQLASLTPRATPTSTLLSGLPATLSQVPWIESLTHRGPSLAPLTSLPNLALLKNPATATTGSINPFYVAQPAPLGLADYGLGAKTYSYNTSHILGEVTFLTPPNVTDPASTGVTEVSGQHDGYVGSLNEFGIQLNTVATNISIPGSDQGFFWTQNVVNYNDTGIHFVSDTFNMTSGTQNPYFIAPGTIYSACNNGSAGVEKILFNYGGVLQCVGGTIPVSPASYPVTIQLYNNATTNAQGRSVVSYGYRIIEAGTGAVFTGVSDLVVFNSPHAHHHAPVNPPGFSIDGFAPSPTGLFRDAEMVLVGNIGGDNSVFRSIDGTIQLEYSNARAGGFHSVPSAYNFGGDTGETSTGIADYWTPSHTLVINQGPAMLYGLWNAIPYASVKSGAIHLAGSITPSYGFVFVSNTPPVLDPWNTSLNERDNMSWLPTTDTGKFSTYLPPLGAPWTKSYFVQAFAAGFQELNGTAVTGTDTSYHLKLVPAPGLLRAPLYAFSNQQLASLAQNVTGASSPPYLFNGLVDNINFTFNHLNDYGYASFVLFMTQGVTDPIQVNNTYQGVDSSVGNFYFSDYALPPEQGLLVPGPAIYEIPFGTSGINIYDGLNDVVTDQVTAAAGYGLQIVLWHDTDAQVAGIVSELGSAGVWVGDSVGTVVQDVEVSTGATGVTDLGSTGTSASAIFVVGALGVEGLSSSGGTYSSIYVESGGFGVSTGADYGAGADYDPYYYLPGTTGLVVSSIVAYNGSVGANISLSHRTIVVGVSAILGSTGLAVDNSWKTAVSTVSAENASRAVYLHHSSGVVVGHVVAHNHSTGVFVLDSSYVTISYVVASHYSIGVYLEASKFVNISHVRAYDHSIAVYVAP
jgi:Thermopsin/Periplasmic copper-binding protein (NosD)